ncbi:cytochrome-c peroxidase [Rhabdochromatium marinum]|uniref:cytochrome-c peroxidase n=1 Tax=Rhabdochromatium marinum TaxID=48729 RepID=UPI001904B0F6|nr:cytochrome c peroxidase [Rhabdochromatium marinum]
MLILVFGLGLIPGLACASGEPIQPLPTEVSVDRERAALGEALFHDTSLSLDGQVSCASCHPLDRYGMDGQPVSTGVLGRTGVMNAPSVYNAAFNYRQFWNARAHTLAEQARMPLITNLEMGLTPAQVEQRVAANPEYAQAFQRLYGTATPSLEQISDALAHFEQTLITANSRFDRFLRGELELTAREHRGYLQFKEFGCIICHHGINVGGNSLQRIGVIHPFRWNDHTRDRYSITGDPEDKNRFRVPSLRNVSQTAPYFHNGSVPTLEAAVQLMAYHNLGLHLSAEETADLVQFLRTLEGALPERQP